MSLIEEDFWTIVSRIYSISSMSRISKLLIALCVLLVVSGGVYIWYLTPHEIPVVPVNSSTSETEINTETELTSAQILANKIATYDWTPGYTPKTLNWNTIGTSPSSIFSEFRIMEDSTYDSLAASNCLIVSEEQFVRYEGGRCRTGYWFVRSGDGMEIRTPEALVQVITPVNTPTAALAIVYATISDITTDGASAQPAVTQIADGYLVHVIHTNTYGCSSHQPYGTVYWVTTNGIVRQVAREPEPEPTTDIPVLCVD